MAATAPPPTPATPIFDVDKLSYEIFSILESKFLFGYDDPKLFLNGAGALSSDDLSMPPRSAPPRSLNAPLGRSASGKVCILSIDGGGRAADGLLAGAALARLESSLRKRTGDPAAKIGDFFDVAAGSGAGGVLAAMLVARSSHGRPLFSAEEAMSFLLKNLRSQWSRSGGRALFRRNSAKTTFKKLFGDTSLKETTRPLLIPCYDLATGAPFLFSRADAIESVSFDFKLRDVCSATCAGAEEVEVKSSDGRRKLVAVGGGVAMGNPTAAAITHVLNNKREFPTAGGVEDLLVVSIGSGEVGEHAAKKGGGAPPPATEIVRIAAEGVADMVDQAVAMAFGHNRASNYIRIQATGGPLNCRESPRIACVGDVKTGSVAGEAEQLLAQKNVESVLFRGKKLADQTNAEKLEWFAHELVKEHDRRKSSGASAAEPTSLAAAAKQPQTPARMVPPPAAPKFSSKATKAAANATSKQPSTSAGTGGSYSSLVGQVLTTIL